ncbi:hypothetical protein [Shimia sp.]|uniref:hypothetical protein n=1 Tax=Shimia sp. TaxID=1954381 RepID=UPI00329A6AA3
MTLSAPDAMQENGFLKFVLPRFMLKHGIRITPVSATETADAALVSPGDRPAFSDGQTIYGLSVKPGNPHAEKFADWLTSGIGLRTILSFKVDGQAVYSEPVAVEQIVVAPDLSGDAMRGMDASLRACGRCHVVGDINRMAGIGSTPSFAVLRSLGNWQERFESFYVLNPHPAFTVIPDVTLPFDQARPPPISPVTVTLDELEDIVAYVADMAPADLGAPILHQ